MPRRPASTAFHEPIATPDQRRAAGKALRSATPRGSHAGWEPPADRVDPIEVLVESNRTRQQDLVPIRYERMAVSPFAFLRGSAAVMAFDLASTPRSGPEVVLCGDAHISNFGIFASPERRLVFDLNDFDEACPGPFEWDVKRFVASIVVAGRANGIDPDQLRRVVIDAASVYRDRTDEYAGMSRLDIFYARIETDDLVALAEGEARRRTDDVLRKAAARNHHRALDKLTTKVDGRWRIEPDPPLVLRFDAPNVMQRLDAALVGYHATLSADRQRLFEQYRFVDFARKVVGVGSVGTRCWILLLQGPNGGPLFLQLKEARHAVPAAALGRPPAEHEGRRVVDGQRSLQAASDVLLGWTTDHHDGTQYYVRQLWDAKASVDLSGAGGAAFRGYVRACAWALARAHARTGDPATMAGYMGSSMRFPEALADFAEGYADQTERDHAALVAALAAGSLP